MEKKSKYLTKTIAYAGKKVTLYSLDGDTWSSRAEELETILARHEEEKATFSGQIKGGPQARIPTIRPKPTSVSAHCLRVTKEHEQADEGENHIQSKQPKSSAAAGQAAGEPIAALSKAAKLTVEKPVKPIALKPKEASKIKPKAALPVKAKAKAAANVKANKVATPKKRGSGRPAKASPKQKAKAGKKAGRR